MGCIFSVYGSDANFALTRLTLSLLADPGLCCRCLLCPPLPICMDAVREIGVLWGAARGGADRLRGDLHVGEGRVRQAGARQQGGGRVA